MESTDSFCNHTNDKQDLLNQEYDYQTKQNIHALTRDDATVLSLSYYYWNQDSW